MPLPPTTHAKALEVNLDVARYGSFAEIGAGQEVGRWFFRVGGAAGTIAKTMSAYDKKVSDAIYGNAGRYVSSDRLLAMIDHEYELLTERLDEDRGDRSKFFAFADTVSAQNYKADADCHGWMGIRFQTHPRAETSQIMLHARMLDRDALLQHEALGILGVNLVHGASTLSKDPERLLESLLDNLGNQRIEIDMAEFSGAAFRDVDHRVMSLRLVEFGLCGAAMFSASGEVLRPSEILYKRPVLLQRGRFRPPTKVHADIQRRALAKFKEDPNVDGEQIVSLLEISVNHLAGGLGGANAHDLHDFLDRTEAFRASSQPVLVSNFSEYYSAAEYLARYSPTRVAMPLGVRSFYELMNGARYEDLEGGVLEAMGRLFGKRVRIYVYPAIDQASDRRESLDTLDLPEGARTLFNVLIEKNYVQPLEGLPNELLRVRSDDVLGWIREGDRRWEDYVEPPVAKAIKSRSLFSYVGPPD